MRAHELVAVEVGAVGDEFSKPGLRRFVAVNDVKMIEVWMDVSNGSQEPVALPARDERVGVEVRAAGDNLGEPGVPNVDAGNHFNSVVPVICRCVEFPLTPLC